jgi:hypothetical protein
MTISDFRTIQMSRTRKGSKAPGWEFWSKRPMSGWIGKAAKKITHKIERLRNKRLRRDEESE